MQLWLLRHAATALPAGTCYGRLDVAAGTAATAAAAQAVAQALPVSVPVRCSPLQRCEQLAQALLGLRPDLPYEIDARLAEMDFGAWEGRPWDAIGPAAVQRWTDDFHHHAPGGGESVAQFLVRVRAALDDSGRAVPRGAPVLWITHAGVARAVAVLAAAKGGGGSGVDGVAGGEREGVALGRDDGIAGARDGGIADGKANGIADGKGNGMADSQGGAMANNGMGRNGGATLRADQWPAEAPAFGAWTVLDWAR